MRPNLSLSATLILLALSSSPLFTNAQSAITTLYGSQSIFIEGKGLYIHGGTVSDTSDTIKNPNSGQTFVIDLNNTWSIESPDIRPLPTLYPSGGTGSTLFNNKTSWFLKGTNAVHIFDMESETWALEKVDNNINPYPSLAAVAVPMDNDYVYLINGYKDANATNSTALMMRYNVQAHLVEPMLHAMPVATDHVSIWSTLKGSAFIYGGADYADQSLFEFFPGNPKDITSVKRAIFGDIPAGRFGHCMVEAYGGAQIYVFGGNTKHGTTSDIYRIDAHTMRWTRLGAGPTYTARAFAACAVTNDMFVAWGGATWDPINKRYTVVTKPIVVYNMRTGEWPSTFDPTLAANSTPPTGIPPSHDDDDSVPRLIPLGGILAGVAGILLLAGIGVGVCYCRRKRQTRRGMPFMKVGDHDGGDDDDDKILKGGKNGFSSSSTPPSSYKMNHLQGNENGNSGDSDQQHPYHQQHPYQEQQHHYQQEPLLDPFADSTHGHGHFDLSKGDGYEASPSVGYQQPPGGNPFASVHDASVKVDVKDYGRPDGRVPGFGGGYTGGASGGRNPYSQ
ncbi:hypothetical protein K457DRAFT_121200 [Linnemannia elongata AG-77]|uniref:Galactose oxidase n=1 Tax=Linnemannia elongata AG-77 TaxID=1314771 RepID=A0A197KBY7_9FUNG|nr:hypothetical protein K457DRAFT_121200 [Linnemannia elongata AG-77]